MAETLDKSNVLKDITECAICTETFTDPRSLPCVHSFCFECIAEVCKDQQPGDQAPCPLCRKRFTIPSNGIGDLPKNFFIGKILAVQQLSDRQSSVKSCDVCREDEDASGRDVTPAIYCRDCQHNICKVCSSFHAKFMKSHATVSADVAPKTTEQIDSIATFCEKHREKPIEIYCFDCETALCIMCCVTEHNRHSCSDVAKVADEFREDLKKDVEMMTAALNETDQSLRKLDEEKSRILQTAKKTEFAICERADELTAMIAKDKHKLLEELDFIKADCVKQIDNVVDDMKLDKHLLEGLKKYCDEMLKKGTPSDIAREIKGLRERAAQTSHVDDAESVIERLDIGDFAFVRSEKSSKESSLIGRILSDRKPGIPRLAHTVTGGHSVDAISLLDSRFYVTRYGLAEVCAYNTYSCQLEHRLSLRGFSTQLRGLAACGQSKCLYVSDCVNSVVHKLDVSAPGSSTPPATKWPTAKKPRGLSLTDDRNVLVAHWELMKIREYTPVGALVREVSDTSRLWQAVETGNGSLLVTRSAPAHGLCEISNSSGNITSSFGNAPGSGLAQMNEPYGMQVSRRGFALVADFRNNRVVVVNPSLTEARRLALTDAGAIERPFSLCYDESRGRLYVGEWGGQRRVLVFDHVTGVDRLF